MDYKGKAGLSINGKNVWHEGNFNPSSKSDTGHKHTKSEITDFPVSLPANGGNADTVGDKSPSDFTLKSYTDSNIYPVNNVARVNLGNPTVTEMALIDSQATNKIWFHPLDKMIFEESDDGITFNVRSDISDTDKRKLVSGNSNASISIPKGKYFRITIFPRSYVFLNWIYMYFSTTGNRARFKCEKKRDDGDWITHFDYTNLVSGWPGHIFIPHSTIPFSSQSTSGHYNQVRITIATEEQTNQYPNMTLYGLEWWGGYPRGRRDIFSYDEYQNVTFPEELKAKTFKNANGKAVAYQDDIPTSLPANGGNADTIDGKHASDFAVSGHTHAAGDLPDGTTSKKGVVQLSASVSSTSTALAATASAVKTAYDVGNHGHPYAPTNHTHTKFVIGTSTAGWTTTDCNYLCDGVGDEAEINSAIAALPTSGGKIVLLAGEYHIDYSAITINKDNVHIEGCGMATKIKSNPSVYFPYGLITLDYVQGCILENFYIACNQYIYNIYLLNSDKNTIRGILGNDYCCSNIFLADSNENIITKNIFTCSGYGMILINSHRNIISDNTCSYCEENGIFVSGSYNSVTGNICYCNEEAAIYLNNAGGNTVTGNVLHNNYGGIWLSFANNNTIVGNTCYRGSGVPGDYGTPHYTIRLWGTANNYNLISSNNCMGKAVAIDGGASNTEVNNKYQ